MEGTKRRHGRLKNAIAEPWRAQLPDMLLAMGDKQVWFIRAGGGGAAIDDFRNGLVAVGWTDVGPISPTESDEEIDAKFLRSCPADKPGSRRAWASQVKRFLRDIKVGDEVVTYDPTLRLYLVGTIESAPTWRGGDLPRVRKVNWNFQAPRDLLSAGTRNSLGSIATLFRVGTESMEELKSFSAAIGTQPALPSIPPAEIDDSESNDAIIRDDVVANADRFVEDRIVRLSWTDLQELVAGVIRAMGYRTRVSPPGPDRGFDIFASRDGLGLEEPRIFVEVKHRIGTSMGAPEIRSFLGGRRPGDRCLYVSTGGFTKDARMEADRSSVPLTLIDLERLRELLVEHYEKLDAPPRSLVPLRHIYWPIA